MKLLVLGASGLIGNAVYRRAKAKRMEVLGTASKEKDGFFAFDLQHDSPSVFGEFLHGEDVCVVIAAGRTKISDCYENEELTNRINVDAVERRLEFCHEHGARPLYLSGDVVFDGTEGNYTEASAVHSLCVYGKQKVAVENFIMKYMPEALIYRIPKVVDATREGNHLFADMYRSYQEHGFLKCIRGLKFNPTDVSDVAECILIGLEKKILGGIYHVANPVSYTRAEIARDFIADCNPVCEIKEVDFQEWNFSEPRALNNTMCTNKFQSAISEFRFTPMRDVIQRFWKNQGRTPTV